MKIKNPHTVNSTDPNYLYISLTLFYGPIMAGERPTRPSVALAESRWSADAANPNPKSSSNALADAIKTIESFLSYINTTQSTKDAWERVRAAARVRGLQTPRDLNEIETPTEADHVGTRKQRVASSLVARREVLIPAGRWRERNSRGETPERQRASRRPK